MADSALFTQSQLDGYKNREILPLFFNRQTIMRHAMRNLKTNQYGKEFIWDLRKSAHVLKSMGKFATIATTGETGDYGQARLPWARFFMSAALAGQELRTQGTPGSLDDGTVRKMLAQKMTEIKQDAPFRLNREVAQGNGQALNANQGVTMLGLSESVKVNPATGTYAGVNYAVDTDWANAVVSPTSGPSADAQADAWYLVNAAAIECRRARGPNGPASSPNIIVGTAQILKDIQNRYWTQNTNVPVNVGTIKTFGGFEIAEEMIDDDLVGNHLYVLSGNMFYIATPAGSKADLFNFEMRGRLQWHVDPKDTAIVFYSNLMQLCNSWPKAHCIVPNWH
jgi:hypothetical protein